MTAVEKLIAKYNKQWNKYGMGSVISYSKVVSDLIKIREKEKEQKQSDYIVVGMMAPKTRRIR